MLDEVEYVDEDGTFPELSGVDEEHRGALSIEVAGGGEHAAGVGVGGGVDIGTDSEGVIVVDGCLSADRIVVNGPNADIDPDSDQEGYPVEDVACPGRFVALFSRLRLIVRLCFEVTLLGSWLDGVLFGAGVVAHFDLAGFGVLEVAVGLDGLAAVAVHMKLLLATVATALLHFTIIFPCKIVIVDAIDRG